MPGWQVYRVLLIVHVMRQRSRNGSQSDAGLFVTAEAAEAATRRY